MTKAYLYTFLAITSAALVLVTHFTLNQSPSAPIGLYWISSEPVHRSAFVLLRNPLKRLVALPGDTVRTTPEGTFVNGVLIPNSGIPKGSPYPPFPFSTFKLQPYQYWALGDNQLSYDSRYIGAVPESIIASTVKPVWVKP